MSKRQPITSSRTGTGFRSCQYCGAKNLQWVQGEGRQWMLVDKAFQRHTCAGADKAAEAKREAAKAKQAL